MWIVYHHEDSWQCGWEVPTEREAVEYCKENPEYRYKYVQWGNGFSDDDWMM